MRVDRGRKKKLIVAFHFQFANQAGWKCDECRKAGLEKKRNCGWIAEHREDGPVVWARRRAATSECPRSFISADSIRMIEEHHAWRISGRNGVRAMPARLVDALFLLESETRAEVESAQEQS
ncbi:MAG: hypothetical protein ACRD4P_08920 [Bryobacteraceae bacterium]